MDDLPGVSVVQRRSYLFDDFQRFFKRHGAPRHPRLKRFAPHVLHRDVKEALVLAGIVDSDDVRMRQNAGCLRFTLEAHPQFRITGVQQYCLDGNGAADGGIKSAVDNAHGSAAHFFKNLIASGFLDHSASSRKEAGSITP